MGLFTVALIDYGSGNLRSAEKALQRAAAEAGLACQVLVTDRPEQVLLADRVVLPGVGAFADCRAGLLARSGLAEALAESAILRGRPFLGICVGMQLLATRGLEHGTHEGLGWIPGEVVALTPVAPPETAPGGPALKIPHMGWNEIQPRAEHPLLAGIAAGSHVYFVHSYHFRAQRPAHVLATADHGGPFAAMIGRDNLAGTQFHPEKSQGPGLRLLANFLTWRP